MMLHSYYVAPQKPPADHKYMIGNSKGQGFFTDGASLGKVTDKSPEFIKNALKKANEQNVAGLSISMDGTINRSMDLYPDCQALWPDGEGLQIIELTVYLRIGVDGILRLLQAQNSKNFIYVDQQKLAALVYLCGVKKSEIERLTFHGEGGLCPIILRFDSQDVGVIMPVKVTNDSLQIVVQ